ASPFEGNISADNYSPPSVGSEQVGASLSYRGLVTSGDQIVTSASTSTTGGAQNYGLIYRLPLNPMNGTLQLRSNWNRNRITQDPFEALDIRGKSELYELNVRQPLVRSPREELALSLGFTYQDGQTFLFNNLPFPFGIGPDADGVSRTSVIKFGQDYVHRDPGGAWSLRSQFSIGTGLFNATRNPDPIPDGQFFSWLGQVQRVQRVGNSQLLILQADVQLTPDSLLPSQQFVIGGGPSVRGYRQNARSGDNGVRLTVEDRIALARDAGGSPILQIAPFVEAGAVWNARDNPNRLPEQTVLASVGLGLLWQPLPRLNLRLDYGVPLVTLRDKGNNIQDDGLYFSVSYQF
ncbi:ShlB/FhaC/HecB family hemolysin secretion/activation protein, partial [Leptolyngbya sp. FACHB-36]|uniref:ShlB/FhaC/HecB family hemolysin secretion/activation protein n=1 Tax=Leptolyngbya sp. FACHB-36 TaxID=2692808 RepID=UPI0016808BBF